MMVAKDRSLDFITLDNERHKSLGITLLLKKREDIPEFMKEYVIIDDGIEDRIPVFAMDGTSAINALEEVIKGCNFHFNQALWVKVQDLGLIKLHKENEEIRNHIKKCAGLAHLPEEKVTDGWMCIMEDSATDEISVKFNDYFVGQWTDNFRRIWTCDEERHRIANSVEVWDNRLNARIRKRHPNIFKLMKLLQEVQYYNSVFL
ncbi:hypothetical protein Trydic_g23678 [Trypoxylus dichotomus]